MFCGKSSLSEYLDPTPNIFQNNSLLIDNGKLYKIFKHNFVYEQIKISYSFFLPRYLFYYFWWIGLCTKYLGFESKLYQMCLCYIQSKVSCSFPCAVQVCSANIWKKASYFAQYMKKQCGLCSAHEVET